MGSRSWHSSTRYIDFYSVNDINTIIPQQPILGPPVELRRSIIGQDGWNRFPGTIFICILLQSSFQLSTADFARKYQVVQDFEIVQGYGALGYIKFSCMYICAYGSNDCLIVFFFFFFFFLRATFLCYSAAHNDGTDVLDGHRDALFVVRHDGRRVRSQRDRAVRLVRREGVQGETGSLSQNHVKLLRYSPRSKIILKFRPYLIMDA